MFTVTVRDERVYRDLMKRVEQRGESVDEVLRELLEQASEREQAEADTPALKLLKLIDGADLLFERSFDARDTEDTLSREAGANGWRTAEDDHRTA